MLQSAAGQGQQKPKGYRYRAYNRPNENAYQPINSSPLAQPPPKLLDDDMEDDEDTPFDSNIPSSPLGRQFPHSSSTVTGGSSCSVFTFGSAPTRRRRPRTPGNDDDEDEDDAVNPSPLFARRRAQYKSTGPLRRSLLHIPNSNRRSLVHTTPSFPTISSPTSSPPVASLFGSTRPETEENPRTAFLKDRFKKRYFARATKARERAVRERRKRVEGMEGLLDPAHSDEEGKERRKKKGKGRCSDDEMESEDEGDGDELNDPVRFSYVSAPCCNTNHTVALRPLHGPPQPQRTTRLPPKLRAGGRELL